MCAAGHRGRVSRSPFGSTRRRLPSSERGTDLFLVYRRFRPDTATPTTWCDVEQPVPEGTKTFDCLYLSRVNIEVSLRNEPVEDHHAGTKTKNQKLGHPLRNRSVLSAPPCCNVLLESLVRAVQSDAYVSELVVTWVDKSVESTGHSSALNFLRSTARAPPRRYSSHFCESGPMYCQTSVYRSSRCAFPASGCRCSITTFGR